jgi:integrase
MSRRSKGARLWLESEERSADGKVVRYAAWVIRDGPRKLRTGCTRDNRSGAEQALAEYLASKYQVPREHGRHPSQILVLDVLNIYLSDVAPKHSDPNITRGRVLTLADWWGGRTLAEVNGPSCREYVDHRVNQPRKSSRPDQTGVKPRMVTAAGARRELEDLRSAINHHRREGLCSEIVSVVLPKKGMSREVWLTRSEAAKIVWAAWRARQVMNGGKTKREVGRHIARFILVGLYTGTRHAAICSAAFQSAVGRGHIDLDRGIFYRRRQGDKTTSKGQPPVRLSERLLAHLRRWHRLGIAKHAAVEWNGKPVASVRKGFAAAVRAAGIDPVKKATPHILRHTAATWAMQNGAEIWQTAGYLGMSPEVLERVYGHHHPDFQVDVAARLSGQKRDRYPVNRTAHSRTNEAKIVNISRSVK